MTRDAWITTGSRSVAGTASGEGTGRAGMALIEILVVVLVATSVLVPLLTLSSRNLDDQQDIAERALAQGLGLDMLERFKRFKPYWTLPGAPGGPPIEEMYLPVEVRPGRATLFDRVYIDQMKASGITPVPKIEKFEDPKRPGLVRLDVTVSWKSSRGFPRSIKFSRWCFAP